MSDDPTSVRDWSVWYTPCLPIAASFAAASTDDLRLERTAGRAVFVCKQLDHVINIVRHDAGITVHVTYMIPQHTTCVYASPLYRMMLNRHVKLLYVHQSSQGLRNCKTYRFDLICIRLLQSLTTMLSLSSDRLYLWTSNVTLVNYTFRLTKISLLLARNKSLICVGCQRRYVRRPSIRCPSRGINSPSITVINKFWRSHCVDNTCGATKKSS